MKTRLDNHTAETLERKRAEKPPPPEKKQDRALILTVGLTQRGDEGIIDSLVYDIRLFKPLYVVMLATSQSRRNAEKIVAAMEWDESRYEIIELAGPHDLREVFQKANEAIRFLKSEGFDPDRISINYTSGTKVMSTGLVLAATFHSCETLRYIKQSGGASGGAPTKSSTTSPRAVFAYRDLTRSITLFEQLRFLGALNLLDEVEEDLLDPIDTSLLRAMKILSQAYFCWDDFRYDELLEHLARVESHENAFRAYLLDESQLQKLTDISEASESRRIEPLILADLFNNAVRRSLEGRYDDALARCYRVLEMLAQWVLLNEFGIDCDDLNTRKVPAKYRPNFEALRSFDDGKVKIGLRKAYELLYLLDHPLGVTFTDNPKTPDMLIRRGQSILAHGVRAIRRKECEAIIRWTDEMVASVLSDFREQCQSLQFSWLQADAQKILNENKLE